MTSRRFRIVNSDAEFKTIPEGYTCTRCAFFDDNVRKERHCTRSNADEICMRDDLNFVADNDAARALVVSFKFAPPTESDQPFTLEEIK